MQYRPLGRTGLSVSALAFGAGPISTLMVNDDIDKQRAVVARALESGVNWFDTAATYGGGASEKNLGRALADLGAANSVHIATKVRLTGDDVANIGQAVWRSVEGSLARLGRSTITLLQLHNSVTARRGDEPTSITPSDVLGPGGVADSFRALQDEGIVAHLGLTGIGQPKALAEVVASGRFATMQVPYHLLNPSAGRSIAAELVDADYGNIIELCGERKMGVLAIRVLAGGALAGNSPSPHTFKTPFFPLSLYERDRRRAARLQDSLGPDRPLTREAIRFALGHPRISAALIGFGEVWQIDEALRVFDSDAAPLDWEDVMAAELSV